MLCESGVNGAVAEITLVFFTTFGPSGAMAYVLLALILRFERIGSDARERLERYHITPVAVTLVSLIASATHLGTPANALFVFWGVGRSPLSNEIMAGVLFLSLSAAGWILSFSKFRGGMLQRLLKVVSAVFALLFVWAVSCAYSVSTVPTWNLPNAPFLQIALAMVLAPLLVLLTLDWAETKPSKACCAAMCSMQGVFFAVGLLLALVQLKNLDAAVGSWANATVFSSMFLAAIGVFVLAEALSLAITVKERFFPTRKRHPLLLVVLSAFGIFAMRFVFYAMHMTSGL